MRYLLIYLFLFSFVFGDNLSQRLERLIQDKRVKTVTILKYDPFFTKNEKKQPQGHSVVMQKRKKRISLRLVCILGNKAFISGKWLGNGDKIHGYKIRKVLQNKVILSKQKK